jgi:hypothetical protein
MELLKSHLPAIASHEKKLNVQTASRSRPAGPFFSPAFTVPLRTLILRPLIA